MTRLLYSFFLSVNVTSQYIMQNKLSFTVFDLRLIDFIYYIFSLYIFPGFLPVINYSLEQECIQMYIHKRFFYFESYQIIPYFENINKSFCTCVLRQCISETSIWFQWFSWWIHILSKQLKPVTNIGMLYGLLQIIFLNINSLIFWFIVSIFTLKAPHTWCWAFNYVFVTKIIT